MRNPIWARIWARTFGALTITFAALNLYAYYVIMPARNMPPGGPGSLRFLLFVACVAAVGVGLLFLRKWAAVAFCLALAGFALWMIVGSIREVPFPLSMINVAVGLCSLAPAVITACVWRDLVWRGEKYL